MLAHRVRIKCSNAFYGVKSIVCNNDRAPHLLAHRRRRNCLASWSAAWIRYIYPYPCRCGITRELFQFVVNAPGIPASPSFSLRYRDKLRLCTFCLASENVLFRRTSVETRTLADWEIRRCGITWEILRRYRTWTVLRLPIASFFLNLSHHVLWLTENILFGGIYIFAYCFFNFLDIIFTYITVAI